jgi:hypothetical protein
MRPFSIGLLTVVLAAAPVSAASAHGFHHRGFGLIGGLFHFVGAVVVGAATIATAPIAIVADAASRDRRAGYDGDRDSYRGGSPGYVGDDQRRTTHDAYYGAPDYYGAPHDGYAPRNMAYASTPYEAPRRDYYGRPLYGRGGNYGSSRYYGPREDYDPPPDYRQSREPYERSRDDDDRYARRDPYSGRY